MESSLSMVWNASLIKMEAFEVLCAISMFWGSISRGQPAILRLPLQRSRSQDFNRLNGVAINILLPLTAAHRLSFNNKAPCSGPTRWLDLCISPLLTEPLHLNIFPQALKLKIQLLMTWHWGFWSSTIGVRSLSHCRMWPRGSTMSSTLALRK